jgi:hypothetical protein
MPRKLRSPKARIDTPPSPALTYFVMAGAWAPARIPGWVAAAQLGPDEAWTLRDYWRQHGEALTDTAASAGFVPYWQAKKRPRGTGYTAWASAFLARYSY